MLLHMAGWTPEVRRLRSMKCTAAPSTRLLSRRRQDRALMEVEMEPLAFWKRLLASASPPFKHQSLVRAVGLSPDGKIALTGSQPGTARLSETATGKPIGNVLLHGKTVRAVALSADGKIALTGSEDDRRGSGPCRRANQSRRRSSTKTWSFA